MQHKVTYKRFWLTLSVVFKSFQQKTGHRTLICANCAQTMIYKNINERYKTQTAGFPSGIEKKGNPLENNRSPWKPPLYITRTGLFLQVVLITMGSDKEGGEPLPTGAKPTKGKKT